MTPGALARLRGWARRIRRDALALWIAARDPRTPWHAKALAACVAAYAFSPIDLIPDFIPVLGLVDDLVIVPLGILLVARLVPDDLMAEFREAAERERPRRSLAAAAAILLLWTIAATGMALLVRRWLAA